MAVDALAESAGVPSAEDGVKPILMMGSLVAVSRLLREPLEVSWVSRVPLGLTRKIGEDEEPLSSCGRRALGRPSTVEMRAGEHESSEVEGDRERLIESYNPDGDPRPGEPATGEIDPILRN